MDLDKKKNHKDAFENVLIVQFSIDHCLEIKSFLWTQFLFQKFSENGIEPWIGIKALSGIIEVFNFESEIKLEEKVFKHKIHPFSTLPKRVRI